VRNTGEIVWRHSQVISPRTVEACVLVPVLGWNADDLDQEVAELPDAFAATLAAWPGDR